VVLDDHFGTEEYGVGTRKDDTALLAKLQKAMDEMKADGSAARISDRVVRQEHHQVSTTPGVRGCAASRKPPRLRRM
jgi:ABC-type amino acid transport substrate-binding protein